ncbi:hypothetical protein LTR86_010167 [Recurvomyces mirabilis]|nr:hypothetical protein LTR86_010167 [Recurvomyces mirabilis]
MKYTTVIAALAGAAIASPVPEVEKRATAINYVQNYNGNLANFKYNEAAGTYSASWNNPGDFVVGLGWTTGSPRNIAFSGSYTSNQGSYYAVYGWLNSPLTEYYVVENYSYDPCNGGTQVGSLTSDGSSYKICTHTQVNQPSIVGTSTFGQYFSVRATKRTSGTVTMANHFNAWKASGFQPGNYNYQVFAVEAFSGTGSASVTVSEAAAGSGSTSVAPTSAAPTSAAPMSAAPTSVASSTPSSAPTGACSALYGQCGGQGWNGPTCCSSGSCKVGNPYYSQCL